jgi:WD40 repeat protein
VLSLLVSGFFFLNILSWVVFQIPPALLLTNAGLVLTVSAMFDLSTLLMLESLAVTTVIWSLSSLVFRYRRTIFVTFNEMVMKALPEWVRSVRGLPDKTRTLAVFSNRDAGAVTALHWLPSFAADQPEQLIVAISGLFRPIYLWTPQTTGNITIASYSNRAGLKIPGFAGACITDLAVSPDHRYIAASAVAASTVDGHIRFFEGRLSSSTSSHSISSQEIINLSREKAALKWERSVPPEIVTSVNTVCWAPSLPYRIAFGASDHTVKIWYIGTDLFDTRPLQVITQQIVAPLIAPQHQMLTYHAHQASVLALAWSQQGDQIVSASADGAIHLWNANTGETQSTYTELKDAVNDLEWSPDGEWIASACADGSVHIWKAFTAENRLIYHGHEGPVLAVAWSPDGKWIASAGQDKVVQVWEAASGHTRLTYRRQSKTIRALAWSLDSQRLASGGDDGIVHVWEVLD